MPKRRETRQLTTASLSSHSFKVNEWLRLLEAVHDDAFADLQDLVGPDLPFDAYWEDEEEGGGGGYTGQAPIWWPLNIYSLVHKHPFWQGKFPHHRAKRRAYSKSPVERTVRTRETGRDRPSPIAVNDDQTVMELLIMGDL